MDVGVYNYPPGEQPLIDKIVNEFLSQGKFDKLRKECMSDADTKPAYQNLQQRVENTVSQFLRKQIWKPDLNKNQLRDSLRKHILESGFFDTGINRVVDQVVNPNVLATVFMPEVEEVVYNYLSIPRPLDRNAKSESSTEEAKYSKIENCSKAVSENGSNSKSKNLNEDYTKHSESDSLDRLALKKNDKDSSSPSAIFSDTAVVNEIEEADLKIKQEPKENSQLLPDKMEITSDESQETLCKVKENSIQIKEQDFPAPDSDDSVPLEINEKSLSESGDSEDSIMNQMSPISQGRLTPEALNEQVLEKVEKKEEKFKILKEESEIKLEDVPKEKLKLACQEKRPSQFVGKIPKIKRGETECSKFTKSDTVKSEKGETKRLGSSDESDSNKTHEKSSEEKKLKERHKPEGVQSKTDKRVKEDPEKKKKHYETLKDSKFNLKDSRSRDKSKDKKGKKRSKSRERHVHKKSSRSESSSRHKNSHRDSKSKNSEKKKKEVEKKKNKSADDHSKEKNKKEDRRSTDRDSNEREKDRSSSGRNHSDNRSRERDEKTNEEKREKQKQGSQVEDEVEMIPEVEDVVIEMDGDRVNGGNIIFYSENIVLAEDAVSKISPFSHLNYNDLYKCGALTKISFPELTDDFYVKFNSTGFKYFEEWEKSKMDCEEEFKEFVDEANNNLDLISDDDTDCEFVGEFNFKDKNSKTITNLLKGLGNFRKAAMFDVKTCEFYRWTSQKCYQKFRRKCEERERRSTEKESDDSIKENIHRKKNEKSCYKKSQALHLKLLNKYKNRAIRQGKQKRKLGKRKDLFEGIKENTDNSLVNGNFKGKKCQAKEETWQFSSKGSEHGSPSKINSDSRADIKLKNGKKTVYDSKSFLSEDPKASEISRMNMTLSLPLSPNSDDSSANKSRDFCKKRTQKFEEDESSSKKAKRNYSQKYDNQDLYKPRPMLNSTRTRGREKEVYFMDPPLPKSNVIKSGE